MEAISPLIGMVMSFFIQMVLAIFGIAAMGYALWGAFLYIISGGEKEKTDKAKACIINAFVGFFLIFVILAVLMSMEQSVFGGRICFGLSCW